MLVRWSLGFQNCLLTLFLIFVESERAELTMGLSISDDVAIIIN